MKQKCILSKKKNTLVIKEVAQTEPGAFSLLFQTEVDNGAIEQAIESGSDAIVDILRSRHFYPIRFFAEKIADGITDMFKTNPTDSLHIEFNDIETLMSKVPEAVEPDKIENEKELAEIDKLLEEDDDAFEIDIDAGASTTTAAATTTPTKTDTGSASIDDAPKEK